MHSISKYAELNAIQQISIILRRHLISNMLSIIEDFKFCSAACHEAIEVLDILKAAFDDEDVETLKAFVKRNLATLNQTHLTFDSGRRATHANLATIVKIAIALKRLTITGSTTAAVSLDSFDAGNDENDSQDEDESKQGAATSASTPAKTFRHLNDAKWGAFCEGRLKRLESKWVRKLESYTEEDHERLRQEALEDEIIANRALSTGDIEIEIVKGSHSDDDDLVVAEDVEGQQVIEKEYLASEFWKVPE